MALHAKPPWQPGPKESLDTVMGLGTIDCSSVGRQQELTEPATWVTLPFRFSQVSVCDSHMASWVVFQGRRAQAGLQSLRDPCLHSEGNVPGPTLIFSDTFHCIGSSIKVRTGQLAP